MEIKSAALIGLGAVGGFFAPAFANRLGEENFCVIAEGERKVRLERGVEINGTSYQFPVVTPSQARPVDLVVMAVKESGFAQAVEQIRGFVGADTQILCVMNGVGHEEQLTEIYGERRVLYSYMRIAAAKEGNVISYDAACSLQFGERENQILSPRVEAVRQLLEECRLPYRIEENMVLGIWTKFMLNIGSNLTCALLGVTYGGCAGNEHAVHIQRALMEEVVAVAQAKGIPLDERIMEGQMTASKRFPAQGKPSTLQDLEQGRKTEIEMFAGKVVEMGEELGIPTPHCWMIREAIQALEEKK